MARFLSLIICIAAFHQAFGLVSTSFKSTRSSLQPLRENFFVDLPTLNDPEKVTPAAILGEAKYKSFVEQYDPDALLLGNYRILNRIRESKLLTATAESGPLEALEARGVTLSKLERALPLIDQLGLLPLLVKNKETLLTFAPLLIEPAPLLLPVLANVLKTSPGVYSTIGFSLAAYGAYDNANILLILLGLPFILLGAVTNGISLPPIPVGAVSTSSSSSSASFSLPVPTVRSFPSAPKASAEVGGLVSSQPPVVGKVGSKARKRGGEGGVTCGDDSVREQDRFLPVANISRIMRRVLPPNVKAAKESKECIQESVSELISFITSEASDKCNKEKRKTINGDDVLWAMGTLGFEHYVEPLRQYLEKYREVRAEGVVIESAGSGRKKPS